MTLPDRDAFLNSAELQPQEAMLRELFPAEAPLSLFDVGACEGESSVRYARLFPQARLFTFEPMPENFRRVEANRERHVGARMRALRLCLSDRDGNAEFHVSSGCPEEYRGQELDWEFGNKSSSLLAPGEASQALPWLKFQEKVTVPTRRLDTLWPELEIEQIDFMHLDVQGAELMVLRGAGARLASLRSLWLEVEAVPLYAGQPLKGDVESFLQNHGFVKLLDTVDHQAGDQFWAQQQWLLSQRGSAWLKSQKSRVRTENRRRRWHALVSRWRVALALRTRLRRLFR